MRRRLAAILAADVVGYSRLMGEDEIGTLDLLKSIRKGLVAPAIAEHTGRVFKLMGDGLLAEFGSVVDAVQCAVKIQEGMVERNAAMSAVEPVKLRIGINLGDVIAEGSDIYGDGVNVAARLEGLAEPGGICVSSTVYQNVKAKLGLDFEDLGPQQVKNIAEPVHAYRVVVGQAPAMAASHGTVSSGGADLALPEKPSIAVLPLDNLSNDPEQDYLADGISEDLITALSKIRWLFVIARNSTFTYKGQAVEVKQVARELGVRYVLEGSVRKAGNRVRVTAQLIDATTGHHVWAERYDREIEDIFDLQDEMTQTIVGAVEPELSAAERDRVRTISPENLDAWACFQRGLFHMWAYDKNEAPEAERLFERTIEIDPNFAPAYAYLSYTHYQNVVMGWSDDAQASLDAGYAAARKALRLDDKDPVAYFGVGRIYMMRGRHDDSISALNTSIALNPSFAQGYHGLGMALTLAGELEEAKAALEMAERLSPRDPILWASTVVHALADVLSGDYEAGVDWAFKTLQNPRAKGYWPHALMAAALAQNGQVEKARAHAEEAVRQLPSLTLAYLRNTLPTKEPGALDPYLDGLRAAGVAES
jgi:adenylate cyclase